MAHTAANMQTRQVPTHDYIGIIPISSKEHLFLGFRALRLCHTRHSGYCAPRG